MASVSDFSISKNPKGIGFVVNGVIKDNMFHHIGFVVEKAVETFPIPQTGQHYYPPASERGLLFSEFQKLCWLAKKPCALLQVIPGVNVDSDVMATFGIREVFAPADEDWMIQS